MQVRVCVNTLQIPHKRSKARTVVLRIGPWRGVVWCCIVCLRTSVRRVIICVTQRHTLQVPLTLLPPPLLNPDCTALSAAHNAHGRTCRVVRVRVWCCCLGAVRSGGVVIGRNFPSEHKVVHNVRNVAALAQLRAAVHVMREFVLVRVRALVCVWSRAVARKLASVQAVLSARPVGVRSVL